MIQRLIYRALNNGIAFMKANPRLVTELFVDTYEIDETEAAGITKLFLEKTPKVDFGYPATDAKFPLISIILGSEGETTKFIGDSAGDIDVIGDEDFGAEEFSSIWQHTYSIMVMSEHPDATTYYYEIAKMILLVAHNYFMSEGLMDMNMNGEDLAPDQRFNPDWVFVRRLVLRANREFKRVDAQSKLGKAFKVNGIFVDRGGSRSDPGPVKTLVTPETGEDDGEA